MISAAASLKQLHNEVYEMRMPIVNTQKTLE